MKCLLQGVAAIVAIVGAVVVVAVGVAFALSDD